MANRKITFEEFWKVYPLHNGKQDAEKVWNRLSANDRHKAFNGIGRYKEYLQRTGVFVMGAQRWLNGRRWEDKYDEPNRVQSETAASGTKKEQSTPVGSQDATADTMSDMDTW